MKTSKECITCKHFRDDIKDGYYVYPCTVCISKQDIVGFEKWEPIETKKMKSTSKRIIEVLKEMFTFSDNVNLFAARVTSIVIFLFLLHDGINSVGDKPSGDVLTGHDIFFVFMILIGIWLLGYFARRPHPNEITLSVWYKIITLKLKIGILKKNLKPFTDLRKYKHKSESHIREMVIEWRVELIKKKKELKELI